MLDRRFSKSCDVSLEVIVSSQGSRAEKNGERDASATKMKRTRFVRNDVNKRIVVGMRSAECVVEVVVSRPSG